MKSIHLILMPQRVTRVKRSSASVCVFVCPHSRTKTEHSTRLSDSNFLVRLLYRDCYQNYILQFVIIISYNYSFLFTCVSYAEARNRYRLDVRPSVCPFVTRWYCISKRLNILSCFLYHTIAHSFQFCVYQDLCEIPTGSTPSGGR